MLRLKEYALPFIGVLLIALGLWVPLGFADAPSLIESLFTLVINR